MREIAYGTQLNKFSNKILIKLLFVLFAYMINIGCSYRMSKRECGEVYKKSLLFEVLARNEDEKNDPAKNATSPPPGSSQLLQYKQCLKTGEYGKAPWSK